ncbi:MAG: zinc-binding dehydrogenase [Candidatus Heimdallarchaeota archaeon]|nr:zinc-binding dehydrogenase [Candidatus Heimdallarchaeota archaeon]MDH5644539.1 zinc-binding dehydrogenase [Candidatus Heimdallarchaeota archaeon]
MKSIILSKTGGPDVLQLSEIDIPNVKDHQVLIKNKYAGINYADLLTRQGLYSWAPKRPSIPGLEVTGIVEKVGKEVTNFKVGDKVVAGMRNGGYAEYSAVDEKTVLPADNGFSWEELGSMTVTWMTAWIALHQMARVRENEILLVQAAAGGVGSSAVQLGVAHGMKVYGTSSPHKFETIKKLGGTPLNYHDFDEILRRNNELPDCVLESIGGDVYNRSFKILAPMGRLITIGGTGIQVNKYNPVSLLKAWKAIPKIHFNRLIRFSKGVMGFHIGYLLEISEKLIDEWYKLLAVMNSHNLRPVIHKDHIFPLSEAGKAHQFIHDRKNVGKVLLDVSK